MSPEQARKPKTVDVRSDIWSLGIILYEFMTGDSPFCGDSPLDLLAAIVTEPLPNLRAKHPGVPQAFAEIIAKCLEKQPENRYQSVAELAKALGPFASEGARSLVGRISGILRATVPPAPHSDMAHSPTLRSHEGTPSWNAATQTSPKPIAHVASTPPSHDDHKHTATGFGHSQPTIAERSKRRTFVVAAACAVALLVAYGVHKSATSDLDSSNGAPAAPDLNGEGISEPQRSPSLLQPPATVAAQPIIVPGPSASAITDGANSGGGGKPNASASGTAAKPKHVPAPRPVGSARAPLEPVDPLDGRR
jgi:serine/threonine-protein kinase